MSISPIIYLRTVICAKSIVESETGNISLIEILEDLTLQIKEPLPDGQPTGFPINFDIVSFWKKEKGNGDRKFDIRLDVIDPQGKALSSSKAEFTFPDDKLNFRFILKMSGFTMTTSGVYKLKLSYKERDEKDYHVADETSLTMTLSVLS